LNSFLRLSSEPKAASIACGVVLGGVGGREVLPEEEVVLVACRTPAQSEAHCVNHGVDGVEWTAGREAGTKRKRVC
jgi:hypothetical protein